MENKNISSNAELPSMGNLIKSTIIAFGMAIIILVTIVLPSEYGIDFTGFGKLIGLVKMGEIKVSLAKEAVIKRVNSSEQKMINDNRIKPVTKSILPTSDNKVKSDSMSLTLKPNEGKEVKLTMKKGDKVGYVWRTGGGRANFDVHGDSKKLKISYHNYKKGSLELSKGTLIAAFDGKHGWFWRNRTSKTMKVSLQVNGDYSDIKLIK